MTSYLGYKKSCTLVMMASNSKSCKRRRGQYCVAGCPNGIRCTNGQYTEGKSIHEFPHKENEKIGTKVGKDLCKDIGLIGTAPIRLFFALTISMMFYKEPGNRFKAWNEKEAKA